MLVVHLDISGFPPANEHDIYFVPADLSDCDAVVANDIMCAQHSSRPTKRILVSRYVL
jgi:hypothetical protein